MIMPTHELWDDQSLKYSKQLNVACMMSVKMKHRIVETYNFTMKFCD